MGEKFVRDDVENYVETDEYVTEEPRRPAPGIWMAGLLLFACLGAAMWFWYKAETSADRPLAVIGQDGPKIIVDNDDAPARYVIVREGNNSRVVGGTAVALTSDSTPTNVEGSSRAETIATYRTRNVDEFVGPNPGTDRVGQAITIENGRVHQATGDKTFSIHDGDGDVLLVFFPEPNTRAGEVAYKIIGGDTVSVTGTLRQMPSRTEAKRIFGLSDGEAAELTDNRLYIDAYRVEVY